MKVFVDTSAFVALENRRDERHQQAVREYRKMIRAGAGLVTSDYIFDETITLLQRRAGRDVALGWGRRLLASSLFEMLVIDREMIERSLGVFESAADGAFSFTDCSSFALMRSGGIAAAFAFDDDFRRFGFEQRPGRR